MPSCPIHGPRRGRRALHSRASVTPERATEILIEATAALPPAPHIPLSRGSRPIPWTPEVTPGGKVKLDAISTRGVRKAANPKLYNQVQGRLKRGEIKPTFAPSNPEIAFDRKAVAQWTWDDVDFVIVQYSGGKDSLAALLWVLASGAPHDKVMLWHQNVDGAEGGGSVARFDWPVTLQYLEATAKHFDLPLYFQYIEGGFSGELIRLGKHSEPMWAQDRTPRGKLRWISTPSTRKAGGLKGRIYGVPAQHPDLSIRWCSSVLKILPSRWAQRQLTNEDLVGVDGSISPGMLAASRASRSPSRQKRIAKEFARLRREGKTEFTARKIAERPHILVASGERRAESVNRATYFTVQPEVGVARQERLAIRWRPVLHLTDEEVYSLIRENELQVHPAYELGFGRCSCYGCIFAGPREFATMQELNPKVFRKLVALEKQLKKMGRPRWSLKGDEKRQLALGDLLRDTTPYERTFWFERFAEKGAGREPFTLADMYRNKTFSWILPLGYLAGSSGGPPT